MKINILISCRLVAGMNLTKTLGIFIFMNYILLSSFLNKILHDYIITVHDKLYCLIVISSQSWEKKVVKEHIWLQFSLKK